MKQQDIFESFSSENKEYSALCAALYERELRRLAYSDTGASLQQLQSQLKSLPFYIKKAALWLQETDNPLVLDSHTPSWLHKQSRRPPRPGKEHVLQAWLQRHVSLGLLLPVLTQYDGVWQVRLDSIDKIKGDEQQIHLNRWGWFSYQGWPLEDEPLQVLKPSVVNVSAACAGHRWNALSTLEPQSLPLRELLLTTLLSWPNFTKARRPLEIETSN